MKRILVIENTTGSVEHYYHFFFAALVPLLDQARVGQLDGLSYIRACGPMDAHLQALQSAGLAELQLVERRAFKALCQRVPDGLQIPLHSEECYDREGVRDDGYRPAVLRRVAEFGIARFAPDAPESDVLLVERGAPDPFYLSRQSAIPGSASTRRSIPNMDAVSDALENAGRTVRRVQLEHTTLAEQIGWFSRAQTVVAQHGAALANVMWVREGSRVVEIIPQEQGRREHFSRLADVVGATYEAVSQPEAHAPVVPEQIVRAVQA